MEYSRLTPCEGDWKDLAEEYVSLQALHKDYTESLDLVEKTRSKFEKALTHQKYRLRCLKSSLKKIDLSGDEDKVRKVDFEKDISRRDAQLQAMEGFLPKKNGFYLSIILGSVNVSILNENGRFKYKEEYEKFKLSVTLIVLCMAVLNLVIQNTVFDLLFMFLLVWYYCTLTIRESILRVNGSRIKGWWRLHHFIATVMSGVLLVWTSSPSYLKFRSQFVYFNIYIGVVQYVQFHYQKGCLYRLKALGDRYSMDITIEGFHSWMWKGLSFLFPLLYLGYFFQLYNAYVLYEMSKEPEAPWPISILSGLFFVVFLGNMFTTSTVIREKMWQMFKKELKKRMANIDKVSWNHRKSKANTPEKSPEADSTGDAKAGGDSGKKTE
ncbi:unnamed protein product [Notodromas monacha]|uniref:Transmembrane protein 120A n=1 Tax=Notodromas monacha TaxID=399045 RepID=A0A7R9GAE7_9CRUS|nr:unnamed protein product [Notodromas monacha]CAG0915279.1 unnamed protein product [Notodromas monacha]